MKKINYLTGLLLAIMLLTAAGCGDKMTDADDEPALTEDIPDEMSEEIVELEEGDMTQAPEEPAEMPEDTIEEVPEDMGDTTEEDTEEDALSAENYRVISLKDLKVYPQEMVIKVGTTVEWRNINDNFNHIIGWKNQKADWGVTPEPIVIGESWSYTFQKPGEVKWFSTARPTIQGIITIEE